MEDLTLLGSHFTGRCQRTAAAAAAGTQISVPPLTLLSYFCTFSHYTKNGPDISSIQQQSEITIKQHITYNITVKLNM